MFTRLRQAGLLWPTLLTVTGLVILVSLGTWQMRRLAWKETLIEKVEARSKAPPVSLESAIGTYTATFADAESGDVEFLRVVLKGRFLHRQEFHVWDPGKQGPAWSVVTPLVLPQPIGEGRRYPLTSVLVIRGAVPHARKLAASRAAGNPESSVELVGRVRFGHLGAFSNPGSAAKNEWYELDLQAMRRAVTAPSVDGSASGSPDEAMVAVAPFYIEAETPTGGAQGPQPELSKINLTNRHLEYALTWYGLAATLLGVFVAYVWSRRRAAG